MTPERKKEMIYGGVAVGGAVVLYSFYSSRQGTVNTGKRTAVATRSSPQIATSSHPTTEPNPQQASLDEAFLAAREQAIQAYDATVLGEKSVNDQLIATNNETAAQKLIAFNQDAAALKLGGMQTDAAEQIAQEQTSAQEQIASTVSQAQVQQTQAQQPQWWQSLLGGLGSIGGLFGFNSPYLNPVGYGTGYVDSASEPTQQTEPDIFNVDPNQVFEQLNTIPQLVAPSNISIGG